jgi:hypothetical protein
MMGLHKNFFILLQIFQFLHSGRLVFALTGISPGLAPAIFVAGIAPDSAI